VIASKDERLAGVESYANDEDTISEVFIADEVRAVIAQIMFHGVIDMVVIFLKDNVVQLLNNRGHIEALHITFHARFILSAEHSVGIVNLCAEGICNFRSGSVSDLVVRALRGVNDRR